MDNSEFNIIVSDTVYKRVKELIEAENDPKLMLRIKVEGGGCSGFMYKYDLVKDYEPEDFIIERDNIKILIDKLSQSFIKGCTVEYIEELGSSYFKVTNPSAQVKCGCGNSFSI